MPTDEQIAALDELNNRRSRMTPQQRTALDELRSRAGLPHPSRVPGTVAYQAAQRQPRMQAATAQAQREARPTIGDKIGRTLKGAWDTTGATVDPMGRQMNAWAREHPVTTMAFPFMPAAATLTEGMIEGVKARGTDMGESIGRGDYLRATGDAIAIGTAPVGGTALADVADTLRDDPYRGLGQAAGIAGSLALPKVVQSGMKATGPLGRSMQRAGARQGARAVGATRLPEMESLVRIDDTGHARGPVPNILESPGGLPVARSQPRLYDKLHETVAREGERVGTVKSSLQRGDYVLDQPQVQRVLASIDDEMLKYAEVDPTTGLPRIDPNTGRIMGSTMNGDRIIRNLENVKSDIMRSAAETGTIDAIDLFSKRDTWNQVYDKLKAGNMGSDLPPTSPAFARKVGADVLSRTINEQIPELAGPNRAFSSAAKLRDELRMRLQPDEGLIGNIGRNIGSNAARGVIYGTATLGSGPFAAVAMGVAALDILRKTFTSTLWRTMSANGLYKVGKFLEAGELQRAAQVIEGELGPALPSRSNGAAGAQQLPSIPSRLDLDSTTPAQQRALPSSPSTAAADAAAVEATTPPSSRLAVENWDTTQGTINDIFNGDGLQHIFNLDDLRRSPVNLSETVFGTSSPVHGETTITPTAPNTVPQAPTALTTPSPRRLPQFTDSLPPEFVGLTDIVVRNELLGRPGIFGELASSPEREMVYSKLPGGARVMSAGQESAVLITPDDSVIRISRGDYGDARPNIEGVLQPTNVERVGRWQLETLPMVRPGNRINPVSDYDNLASGMAPEPLPDNVMADLDARIRSQGYEFWDQHPGNVGRTADGQYVVIDGGAVRPLQQTSSPRSPSPPMPLPQAPTARQLPDLFAEHARSIAKRDEIIGAEAESAVGMRDANQRLQTIAADRRVKSPSTMSTPLSVTPSSVTTSTVRMPSVSRSTPAATLQKRLGITQAEAEYMVDTEGLLPMDSPSVQRLQRQGYLDKLQQPTDKLEAEFAAASGNDVKSDVGDVSNISNSGSIDATRPEVALDQPVRGAITPKQMPKLNTGTVAAAVDYSKLPVADLKTRLIDAQRARDTAKRTGAGSKALSVFDKRVRDIQSEINSRSLGDDVTGADKSSGDKPKRISANRNGRRIEGTLARSFDTRRGRAMILRADDGSERMVFESEVAT